MEMVLTEGIDYGLAAIDIYEDNEKELSSITEWMYNNDSRYRKIIYDTFGHVDKSNKDQIIKDTKEKIDDIFIGYDKKLEKISNIEEQFDKILKDPHMNKTAGIFDKKADDHLVRYLYRSLDNQKDLYDKEIKMTEDDEKHYTENIDNEKDGSVLYTCGSYYYNKKLQLLSKVEKGYADLLKCIMKIAQKSKIKDLKTEEPDGTISYRR